MKQHLLSVFLFLGILSSVGCGKDRLDFFLERFIVNDQFVDNSGRYPPDAVLRFEIGFRADDPRRNYAIEDFEFSYTVNGSDSFVIQSDRNMNVDAFTVSATVDLLNLELPDDLGGELITGDVVVFNIWAVDSDNDVIERSYTVEIK